MAPLISIHLYFKFYRMLQSQGLPLISWLSYDRLEELPRVQQIEEVTVPGAG